MFSTLLEGEESGLWKPLTPSSRRISAFVLAILLLSKSKSALLVTGITCGADKTKGNKKLERGKIMTDVVRHLYHGFTIHCSLRK